jgi:CBS domain-containing protein
MRYIVCRFCGYENPTGGDACENCGAEFSEGMPEAPATFEGRLLGTRLGALPGTRPLWLDAGTGALAAVERMKADGVDFVLVGDARAPLGIFTDRDAMLKLPGRTGSAPTLRELMTRDPVVLRADDTVAVGIHKMAVGGFRHLPLADERGVTMVIAARDVFRHLATRLDEGDGAGEPDSSAVGTAAGETRTSGRPAVRTD